MVLPASHVGLSVAASANTRFPERPSAWQPPVLSSVNELKGLHVFQKPAIIMLHV